MDQNGSAADIDEGLYSRQLYVHYITLHFIELCLFSRPE